MISETKGTKVKPAINNILGNRLDYNFRSLRLVMLITGSFSLFPLHFVDYFFPSNDRVQNGITMRDVKREIDLNLLAILVFSLVTGNGGG